MVGFWGVENNGALVGSSPWRDAPRHRSLPPRCRDL